LPGTPTCQRDHVAKVLRGPPRRRAHAGEPAAGAIESNRLTTRSQAATMTEATTFGPLPPLQQPPSVDVGLPVRNRARFIRACLDSVRAQTLQPATVLAVDDGSADDTAAILADYAKAWPKLRVIRTAARGVSPARNTALAAATADLVA